MFHITPADEQKTAALARREGAALPLLAMVLTVDGAECGYALYRVDRDLAEIVCLRSQDAELEEWLVRAVLNAAANRNAITAYCCDPVLFPLLQRLHFTQNDKGYEVFIPEFFTRPCHGV